MDSVNRLPELDTRAVAAAYRARAQAACPQHLPLALRLLERLEPARWRLEWHLPWWLGQDVGLDTAASEELALSNVLGLASIRLRDDLLDGDLDPGDTSAVPVLSAALYEAAIDVYRSLFSPASELWDELGLQMADWRRAINDNAAPPEPDADTDAIARHLARRGAPLKVSAFAICLLTGRTEIYPKLDRCLDHALAAMVLHDHLSDWQDDLAAGRWNAFVAAASTHEQSAENRDRNRAHVMAAMMARDAVATHVERIHVEFDVARGLAIQVELPGLASQLAGVAAQIDEHATQLQGHYRQLGERAVALLLGNYRPGVTNSPESARLAAV